MPQLPIDTNLAIGFWFTMIIMIFIAFTVFIMNAWIIYHLYFMKNNIFTTVKITSILCLLSSTVCILSDFVHIQQGYALNKSIHKYTFHEIRCIADFFMFISLISFFSNLYVRLIKSFDDTPFSLSATFKICSHILLFIVIVLDIIYISLVLFHQEQEIDELHAHIYGLFTYFHVLLFVIIVTKFTFTVKNVYNYLWTPSFKDDNNNNQENKYLLALITKYNVLSFISLILFLIRFIYRQCLGYFDENNFSEYVWFISYIGRDIVLLSMASFIHLTLKFNSNHYDILCKHCDNCCASICISFITENNKTLHQTASDKNIDKKTDVVTSINMTISSVNLTTNGDDTIYDMENISNPRSLPSFLSVSNPAPISYTLMVHQKLEPKANSNRI